MPHYILTYFPLRGRGESIRILFHQAGVPFEEENVEVADWCRRKPDFPLQQLPVLEVDGKMLCQSKAILRYLAEEFGLAGQTNWEKAKAQMVVDTITDFMDKMWPLASTKFVNPMVTKQPPDELKVGAYVFRGPLKQAFIRGDGIDSFNLVFIRGRAINRGNTKELTEQFKAEVLDVYLQILTKLLTENGSYWFAGSQLTWADICFAVMSERLHLVIGEADMLKSYPLLKNHFEKIFNLPRIAEYLKNRPERNY